MADKIAVRKEWERLRRLGWLAGQAWDAATTIVRFNEQERRGLVKLEVEPEIDYYDEGDMFDPKIHTDISPKKLERERKDLYERIEREGYWILVGYCRPSVNDEWESTDSIGGFIGQDYIDSGYDTDIKRETLAALDAIYTEAAEELASRATYAGPISSI